VGLAEWAWRAIHCSPRGPLLTHPLTTRPRTIALAGAGPADQLPRWRAGVSPARSLIEQAYSSSSCTSFDPISFHCFPLLFASQMALVTMSKVRPSAVAATIVVAM